MSQPRSTDDNPEQEQTDNLDCNLAVPPSDVSSVAGSVKNIKQTTSERQIKFERAQKCLENAALVSKRIKEHRKATAELLGRPFEDDSGDTEMASAMSERTNYSVTTDTSTTLSVQDALNIPGISESLANTLKQKELLMERIKQYKEISKRPSKKNLPPVKKYGSESSETNKTSDVTETTKLVNTIKEKENALSIMQVKIRAMETTILDLQEKIHEKDQIIESKNRATTLITDSLSKKEKDTLHLLEDTKQQMSKMQTNFVAMEMEWNEEKHKLLLQIDEKDEKIKSLEEANTILENSRFEISIAHSKLCEEHETNLKEILELQDKLNEFDKSKTHEKEIEPEKGSLEINNMEELTKKVELLEQINYQIRQTNKELENQLVATSADAKLSKKGSPLPSRKGGRNASSKMKSPWSQLSSESLSPESERKIKTDKTKSEMLLQSLNKDILDKEMIITQKDETILNLQTVIKEKINIIDQLQSRAKLEKETFVHVDTMTDNHDNDLANNPIEVKDLEEKLKESLDQITILNNEIDVANKNMIKVKSNTKLKLKQMQKSIDNFSKVSDTNAEIVKLNEELHQLSQKVAELEEEKGNLQLHLVDYDGGRLTESEIYKKMIEMENLAEARLKSITLLETQKFDLVQDFHNLQQRTSELEDKLADMSILQNEQVCSEMKLVQMEEQIDDLSSVKREMDIILENLKLDKEQLNGNIKVLQNEKEELTRKLDSYIQENIELSDKLEKLSAEKVSSAESIEIVESLTTQEKMELEEYNRSIDKAKKVDDITKEQSISKEELMNETEELKKKIDLFTQERQEVMKKMNKISSENEYLLKDLSELRNESGELQENIDMMKKEKQEIQLLNEELNNQIEELKRERIEVLKETVEVAKRASIDDIDGTQVDVSNEEKSTVDKGVNRSKSVKQLTKEILKLKNVIKEREDEIADCQMKILSLEEQQEKQKELLQNNTTHEVIAKRLIDENNQLKEEIATTYEKLQSSEQLKKDNDLLQLEIQKQQQEYHSALNISESRINELEKALLDYEKQAISYVNSLQLKDKEMTEYINQITKLNDISQKLKTTVELLEEEKEKNQNADLIKSLSKQISMHQKALSDCEEKIHVLEEEKLQLTTLKTFLENKNKSVETELKALQDTLKDKQILINELQAINHNRSDELSVTLLQAKERDEEIHEIKLQLRKESIENEKLRTAMDHKDRELKEIQHKFDDITTKFNSVNLDINSQNENLIALENKNKELLEKLKKFALSIKKKTAINTDLENQLIEIKKLNEQLLLQGNGENNEKLKNADVEIKKLQSHLSLFEAQNQKLQEEIQSLRSSNLNDVDTITKLNEEITMVHDRNKELQCIVENLNKKIVECEIEQKNNMNLVTKLSCLEAEVIEYHTQINDLCTKLQDQDEKVTQLSYSYEAKIQECNLYVESLQSEIDNYKGRIYRLEQSISTMENNRQSLERKADQLDYQLQEKQKAYSDYSCQEDELVARLAVLIDHDKVVEKQLHEIERENDNLKNKIISLDEELQKEKRLHFEFEEKNKILEVKADKLEVAESEIIDIQNKLHELGMSVKQLTKENYDLEMRKKKELEDLEGEFNTQIENSIKERKSILEKCEKLNEHNKLLEIDLNQYKDVINKLNINNEDLVSENQRLVLEVSNTNEKQTQPRDYTEQYLTQIKNLNSQHNDNVDVINDLNIKIQYMETNTSSMNCKISQLTDDLNTAMIKLKNMEDEIKSKNQDNEYLQTLLIQKEEQVKQLKECKKLVFEMNIPKTEGMTISSTIEPLNEDKKETTISEIESQILDDTQICNINQEIAQKTSMISLQSVPHQGTSSNEEVLEKTIIPKKTYVCFQQNEEIMEISDPFNSEEGWGIEASDETEEITPGLSHLNKQIHILKDKNEKLKNEQEISNVKLSKAIKKLKELKSMNEMLKNELSIAKQLSQSSFLDVAIEKELAGNVAALEKKVEDLNIEITRENREKVTLKKQNEVLKNANDHLLEIKEKMDSEIELWKYNLKQANDKLSSVQWDSDHKESLLSTHTSIPIPSKEIEMKNEMLKLEKENDELQALVENLDEQNKDLSKEHKQLIVEINSLNQQLQDSVTVKCDKCEKLNQELGLIQNLSVDLENKNTILAENVKSMEDQIQKLNAETEILKHNFEEKLHIKEGIEKEMDQKNNMLLQEIENLKCLEQEASSKITRLLSELDVAKSSYIVDEKNLEEKQLQDISLQKKYVQMEDSCLTLQTALDQSIERVYQLESSNQDLLSKCNEYEEQIIKLNGEINNLNKENDQLLSTVAELRSSISTAMDQRGFEIAELWKQHLAQREDEFQKVDQDLRNQLNASQDKYEQLLENMQLSSQEETNKIIIMEQITSLQNKLKEKEEHLLSLQENYAEVVNQLHVLRSEMDDEKLIHDNKLLMCQEENEKSMRDLTIRYKEQITEYETKINDLQTELTALNADNSSLNLQIRELKYNLETEVQDLRKQLQYKESEIFQKARDFSISLSQRNEEFEAVRKQLIEYEKRVEELSFEKESELAILRLKLHEVGNSSDRIQKEYESEKISMSQELSIKIVECTNLNKTITDLNKSLEEYSSKTTETQMVLESQELEIVSLKEEISSLKEILRAASLKIEKHVTFASDYKVGNDANESNKLNKELLDAVPKAELDLALYMLHQRDVRCEELTMELTQLLEERDTLQLRLSDSLRSYEELKLQIGAVNVEATSNTSSESMSELAVASATERHGVATHFVETHRGQISRSSSISDPDGGKLNLQAKLSELRGVKHSRDVRLRHESEQRQIGMRLLQRDVANLPPEALDQLTQAQNTLSRDTQSTPTVLLNWLRGKSTPKVVDM